MLCFGGHTFGGSDAERIKIRDARSSRRRTRVANFSGSPVMTRLENCSRRAGRPSGCSERSGKSCRELLISHVARRSFNWFSLRRRSIRRHCAWWWLRARRLPGRPIARASRIAPRPVADRQFAPRCRVSSTSCAGTYWPQSSPARSTSPRHDSKRRITPSAPIRLTHYTLRRSFRRSRCAAIAA